MFFYDQQLKSISCYPKIIENYSKLFNAHGFHGYYTDGFVTNVDTYMRFLERGRELIAAQVVETSC